MSSPLSEAWISLGWRRPVSDWLDGLGLATLAGFWGLLWLRAVDVVVLTMAGAAVGLVAKQRWLLKAVMFSAGFVIVPYLWSLTYLDPRVFGWRIIALDWAWNIGVMAWGPLAALVTRTIRTKVHPLKLEGFPVEPKQTIG